MAVQGLLVPLIITTFTYYQTFHTFNIRIVKNVFIAFIVACGGLQCFFNAG